MLQLNNIIRVNINYVIQKMETIREIILDHRIEEKDEVTKWICWYYNAIVSDYVAITSLFQNMNDVEKVDLRPLFCILRSTLEKYADLANVFMKQHVYLDYIEHLNVKSASKFYEASGDENQAKMCRQKAYEYAKNVKYHYRIPVCNRLSRYYLIKDLSFSDEIKKLSYIREYNKTLTTIDSKYSQLLHNNLEVLFIDNYVKSNEIITFLHYMMYVSTLLIDSYFKKEKLFLESHRFFTITNDTIQLLNEMNLMIKQTSGFINMGFHRFNY